MRSAGPHGASSAVSPTGTIAVNGHPVAYRVRGRGVPLVLIAGTGYPGATWAPELVDALAARHTVVTFDHRGTGRTARSVEPYSTRLFACDALGLLDGLGFEPAHVLGHSMGGRVAQWMALDRPECIRTLILAATGPGQFREDRPVTRGVPIHTAVELAEKGYERYMRDHMTATFFTPEFAAARPDRVAWLHEAFWQNRPDLENYLRHVMARQEHQTAERLGEIHLPTLVLIGDRDTAAMGTGVHTEQSDYLLEHIPGATKRVIKGASHGMFWSHPREVVDAILEWTGEH